jgi:alkylhydroperoxidase family enzyme
MKRFIACGKIGAFNSLVALVERLNIMARIPYANIDQAAAEYKALLSKRPALNLYRMLPHAGPAAVGFLQLGGALLGQNELDSTLREIAVLRVGLLSKSQYEVHQHRQVARKVGLADHKVAALELGADISVLDERERFVLEFTDQVFHHVKADGTMFKRAQNFFSERQLSELVLTIGFYMMVCRFLENFEVDLETPESINWDHVNWRAET